MAPLSIDNVIRVWPGASTALALSGSGLFMPQYAKWLPVAGILYIIGKFAISYTIKASGR